MDNKKIKLNCKIFNRQIFVCPSNFLFSFATEVTWLGFRSWVEVGGFFPVNIEGFGDGQRAEGQVTSVPSAGRCGMSGGWQDRLGKNRGATLSKT